MKILLIEDEIELAESITSYLQGEKYLCETAATFEEAVEKVNLYEYDCILLDLGLPGGDGLQILEQLKSQQKAEGIIIISARNALEDKITGLTLGADDYLPKPFHLSELTARILSVVRRRKFDGSNLITCHEIQINLLAKTVHVHGQALELTRKEFDLLVYLIGSREKVVSKTAIAEHLSGDMADALDNYDFIYQHIKNLKHKLDRAGSGDYLKTIYGLGYKWHA